MTTANPLTLAVCVVSSVMMMLWRRQTVSRNAGNVDLGWVICIVLTAGIYNFMGAGPTFRKMILFGMVTAWGFRLAKLLFIRLASNAAEDPRYQSLRSLWKGSQVKFFLFYQLQALTVIVLSLPFWFVSRNTAEGIGFCEIGGALIWLAGFYGETLADFQLAQFKAVKTNQGKPCDQGLWRYSRHPNYFFEWVVWIGYAVYASGSPHGIWAWVSPALMLYFLLFVSGIPPAEAQALRSKGEAYRAYQRKTSVFFPRIPRHAA